jgi:hypothetical protein
MGLTAYECVMTGVVGIAFHFDLCQIILQQIDIFLHEFLKYRHLVKVSPGTVGDINNVTHLFSPYFDVCSRSNSECQSVMQYLLDLIPRNDGICNFIRVVIVSINL